MTIEQLAPGTTEQLAQGTTEKPAAEHSQTSNHKVTTEQPATK